MLGAHGPLRGAVWRMIVAQFKDVGIGARAVPIVMPNMPVSAGGAYLGRMLANQCLN